MTTVRAVTEADLPALLALLEAKAEFDGARGTLRATLDNLRAELFAAHPGAQAIVAVEAGVIVAMATYYATFSSFIMKPGLWLDDLYVHEQHRGQGIGRQLIKWLCELAAKNGWGRIDWIVAERNESGRGFYTGLGATIFESVRLARLDEAAIRALAHPYA
jgi:GNAT superfamily N-acetyltransferase